MIEPLLSCRSALLLLCGLLWACRPSIPAELQTIEADETIPPAADVRWESADPVIASIEYKYPGSIALESRSETDARTDHHFLLTGVPPGLTVQWRPVETGGQEAAWEEWQVPDRHWEGEAPEVVVSNSDDPGYLGLTDAAQFSVWVLDPQGKPVWWKYLGQDAEVERVRLLGNTLYSGYTLGADDEANGHIRSDGLDGQESEDQAIPHHHDFLIYPDRLVLFKRVSGTTPDGKARAGDMLVERVGEEETVIWNSFEGGASLDVDLGKMYPQGIDYTHCNGVYFEPKEDAYWISCKLQQAIFVVTRGGELLRVIGGPNSTFSLDGPGFGEIHTPYLDHDLLYVYNNSGGKGYPAQGEVYKLDLSHQRYTQVDARKNPDFATQVHGNITPTQTGGLMVAYGFAGMVEVLDSSGKPRLQVKSVGDLGYVEYLPSLSGPVE